MHFKMSSAISFNLDQSKFFSSDNGLSITGIEPELCPASVKVTMQVRIQQGVLDFIAYSQKKP